jgi:pyridoxal/pyridoxine/pyridoxamine kinase
MNKPQSMSMKDYLIRTLASKLMINEKTIDKVISHQFRSANDAMTCNNSVEISGFGKFVFNEKKAAKKIQALIRKQEIQQAIVDSSESTTEQIRKAKVIVKDTIRRINLLKPTIDDKLFADLRGLEE